jgi:hypothetical protein
MLTGMMKNIKRKLDMKLIFQVVEEMSTYPEKYSDVKSSSRRCDIYDHYQSCILSLPEFESVNHDAYNNCVDRENISILMTKLPRFRKEYTFDPSYSDKNDEQPLNPGSELISTYNKASAIGGMGFNSLPD